MTDWTQIVDEAVELRHHLHRNPELTWKEVNTARTIREQLDCAGISWRACAQTGTIGTLSPSAGGRHIALRADIDALPIQEAALLPYTSQVEGCMHACGHDGHTATLIAAARWLKSQESALPGPVSLLFQPAEEGGHGAKKMIEDGALKGVDVIFGWHNWPSMPYGSAACPDGTVMSANGTFYITVTGRGGHASQPEQCSDPVLAASAIHLALQQVVSRRIEPQTPTVVAVTSIVAESKETITPERAKLSGSVRVARTSDRDEVFRLIQDIAEHTARAYGVTAEVEVKTRYGATVNHPAEATLVREALEAELGESWQCTSTPIPVMASEDFSYYLQEIPGAFALVGAGKVKSKMSLHNPSYDFNDDLIAMMGRVFSQLVGAPPPR
jgi:amidohydrolase